MTNNEKLKALLVAHQISVSRCAEIISKTTGRPIAARTVQSWANDPTKPSARCCPDGIVESLESYFDRMQILLPSTFMASDNASLTLGNLNWVLRNAAVIKPNMLGKLKKHASHPLMKEESAYDDVPTEVLAAFVMEPYFPRRHFDRAFAWLFGKETISQIDAESFRYHEQLKNKNQCYSLSEHWARLPFTQDEYCHVYDQFGQLLDGPHGSYLDLCKRDLKRHYLLTSEMYFKDGGDGLPSVLAHADIADRIFEERIKEFNDLNDVLLRKQDVRGLMTSVTYPLTFENLSMAKRDSLLSMFTIEQFGLNDVSNIYRHAIPDAVFSELLGKNLIHSDVAKLNKSVVSDMRLPLELATEIAFSSPETYAVVYFKRGDVSAELRHKFISSLTHRADIAIGKNAFDVIGAIGRLILTGLPTYPEIELILAHYDDMAYRYNHGDAPGLDDNLLMQYHDDIASNLFVWSKETGIELPLALQDKLTKDGFNTYIQFQMYQDVSSLVDAIKAYYGVHHSNRPAKSIHNMSETAVLSNRHWTHEYLLELVHASRREDIPPASQEGMNALRQEVFYKLFSESFYPSLFRDDLTGPYGRAENLLAHLLDGDAELVSDFNINLIIHSGIQLDYVDDEVDLAASLARCPELNERIVSERLRLQVEHLSDTPSLAPASRRRTL